MRRLHLTIVLISSSPRIFVFARRANDKHSLTFLDMALGFVNAKSHAALERTSKRQWLADMVTQLLEALQLVIVLATVDDTLHLLVVHHALREASGRGETFRASALRAFLPKSQLVIETALAYDGKAVVLANEGRPRRL